MEKSTLLHFSSYSTLCVRALKDGNKEAKKLCETQRSMLCTWTDQILYKYCMFPPFYLQAFNYWLHVPEDKLQIIAEVTQMLHNASLL